MKFAVLALPRSGTTWAANWLTCDGVVCHHDPMEHRTPQQTLELDAIACTGLWLRPDLVARLDCPVACLWREPWQVNESLCRVGLGPMPDEAIEQFRATPGHWFHWRDLFDAPHKIWALLRDSPFDEARHTALSRMNVQPLKFAPDMTILKEFNLG